MTDATTILTRAASWGGLKIECRMGAARAVGPHGEAGCPAGGRRSCAGGVGSVHFGDPGLLQGFQNPLAAALGGVVEAG